MAESNLTYRIKQFEMLADRIDDLIPFWNRVIPLIHNVTMQRFSKAGPGWAPLATSTIRQRIREGTWRVGVSSDQPILQREGDLRRSVMASSLGGNPHHFETLRKRSLSYGTNLKKAVFLQGNVDEWIPNAPGSAYSYKLPPRPFLYLNDQDLAVIGTQAVGYVESVI